MNQSTTADTTGPITLSFPVSAEMILLARLTGAAIASRAGFDIEETEDFRLAMDEICLLVAGDSSEGSITLEFELGKGTVVTLCTFHPTSDSAPRPARYDNDSNFSVQILKALVDEYSLEVTPQAVCARISKSAAVT